MRILVLFLLLSSILFSCSKNKNGVLPGNSQTIIPVDTFHGIFIIQNAPPNNTDNDTFWNYKLYATVYGNDSAMQLQIANENGNVIRHEIAEIDMVLADSFAKLRTGYPDTCTIMQYNSLSNGVACSFTPACTVEPVTLFYSTQ